MLLLLLPAWRTLHLQAHVSEIFEHSLALNLSLVMNQFLLFDNLLLVRLVDFMVFNDSFSEHLLKVDVAKLIRPAGTG